VTSSSRRRAEVALVAYSPVWIAAMAWVMLAHVYRDWGDPGHLVFGIALALPVWLAPLALSGEARVHGLRLAWLITIYSLLQTAFGSWLFFDVFGMTYSFATRWIFKGSPVFLYFVTIAYFATYFVVLGLCDRAFARGNRWRWPLRLMLCYGIAFAETFAMASPVVADVFTYRDPVWMARWGSIFYGTVFVLAYPQIGALFDEDHAPPSWRALTVEALARNMLILIVYEIFGALLIR
jgi:cycloeucalenol cycloisomerase